MNNPVRGLHRQAVEVIGEQIVRGTYAPGDSLHPDRIEQELGVSKTVVREALRVLASKGLIDSRQKRGTFVRPRADWNLLDSDLLRWQGRGIPDEAFLDNLGEVRGIVEPAGARLAAERRDEADLAALEDALDQMAAAGSDAHAAVEADLAFHRALLAAAHNELLTRMEVVIEAGLRVRDHIVHSADNSADAVPAHRAVLDAVRAQDADAAARAVEELLAQAAADLHQLTVDADRGDTG
ncbi:DNA-binding FadR family transcriptional regulator [Streptomyces sp. 1114.5]|uniref:FadR/GntR family transcriptional regulator n=1 Tax=unclassified Streptomyces TaxID=2593676 RepID=UPI000BDBDA64|nr:MULTISPECIES: FadR/GntR family transcriptional regulator [unclassified Streptomyces]RKT12207.1 DNA-binding FadR family transcriptional regulator [Streptomyces sp. 1114.5]SOB79671.1 DNA-binding transcriptional regulator, FadR family [Streptomyces sp. 1331.2]